MRIVLDAMGSDSHPDPELQAAVQAADKWGDPVLLTGPSDRLKSGLEKLGAGGHPGIEVHDAPDVLEMSDKPAESARRKPNNSMAIGMDLIKQGQADAFVTAGNTGGAMANALFRLGRIRGVKRPALSPVLPVRGGRTVVIDIGANADCRPEYLLQFAIMGSAYARASFKISEPRVGLLSNGEEAGKGNQLIKETYPLLAESGLNFIGNIEPKELYGGAADVAICDGFTGNILLKTSEAVAKLLTDMIRQEIRAGALTTLGGMLARPAFRKVAKILDPAEYGAVPLLGIDGLVFVGHGRSDARALVNAIGAARSAVQVNLLEALHQEIKRDFAGAASAGGQE